MRKAEPAAGNDPGTDVVPFDDPDALPVKDPNALDYSISEYTGRPVKRKGRRYWMARAVAFLASKAATAPRDGKSPEPLVVIHIDWETYRAELDRYLANGPPPEPDIIFNDQYLCEDSAGNPVRPGKAFELSLRHAVARCVIGADSREVDLGRKSRLFTGAARDAVIWRDRRCVTPGCGNPGQDVDHRTEWDDHGQTNPANGDYLCKPCHMAKTRRYNNEQTNKRWAAQRQADRDHSEPF